MKTRNYELLCTGLTPLLMHFDNVEAQDEANEKGKTGGPAGDDRYPPTKWTSYLYMSKDAVIWPATNMLSALLKVGGSINIGSKKTLKAASQSVAFDSPYLDFKVKGRTVKREDIEAITSPFPEHRAIVRALGFDLMVCPVRLPTGSRNIRVRPQFDEWTIEGSFSTDDQDLTTERLQQLFTVAGLRAGCGDWRPGAPKKPGPYGRFKATVKEV